jgi:2-amino-4-hydroxy-6-hydroxymethyldihydropteridine diphosphokinase
VTRVFLALGSNLGDRRERLAQALRCLGECADVRVVARSTIYETEPWPEEGVPRERWYLNCAVEIETTLPPHRLLALLQDIEGRCGRVRPARLAPEYADRTMDIDILLYGDRVLSEFRLQIPHPLLHERRFVLQPLAEIAPELEHPTLYQTIRELLAELRDDRGIQPYAG